MKELDKVMVGGCIVVALGAMAGSVKNPVLAVMGIGMLAVAWAIIKEECKARR